MGVRVDTASWTAYVTLDVLSLPEDGPPPEDRRVLLVLHPVGRIAASLRHGLWNDETAPVEPFTVDRLDEVVQSFGHLSIYGWDFFDVPESENFARWSKHLSLDVSTGAGTLTHSLAFSQDDAGRRTLNCRLWFDGLTVRDPAGAMIPLERFAADGRRWWDALHRGDVRTAGSGIIPFGD